MRDQEARSHGKDLDFKLPIRICEMCGNDMKSASAVRDALRLTPVYARLLDKYPHATISKPY